MKAQFNDCPVTWMFHSCSLNDKINRLHERCLRVIYNDKRSSFEELLAKDNSVSVHPNNIHALAINMCKVANGISPGIANDVFNLIHTIQFLVGVIHSVFNGSESASYLGRKIWEQIPTEIKNKDFFVWSKKEIRKWKPLNCPCRICKTFIANLDFI